MSASYIPDAISSDMLHALEVVAIKPSKPVDLRQAALFYATQLDWPIFPVVSRGKKPLGQVVPHGLKDATTNPALVERWWTDHPDANIATPTGPRATGGCGLDVIDADGRAGIEAWKHMKHRDCPDGCSAQQWCEATGGFDIRAEALTPGDPTKGPGRHIYIPATGKGNSVKRNGASPLDYRGSGGYVVLPPSQSLAGVRYSWIKAPK